jgi:hypothetical protein
MCGTQAAQVVARNINTVEKNGRERQKELIRLTRPAQAEASTTKTPGLHP